MSLKEKLIEEIEDFRQKGHEFLNKEITVPQFKGISGGFGVYAHRGGEEFMVRLKFPSGVATLEQFNKCYEYAKQYGLDKVHLTTREAIQLHGLGIDEVCDIMIDALSYNIITRGSGGNYPRNVALSPLSGVEEGEAFDVTPYAIKVGKYFEERVLTYKLPRKLKVSFSNTAEDTAHATMTDLGFIATLEDGKEKFKVYLGGGLGRNPSVGVKLDDSIDTKDVLYYVQGMVSFFMKEGDYENKGKARIRYIKERMGDEAFKAGYLECVKEEMAKGGLDFTAEKIGYDKAGKVINIESKRLFKEKKEGLYSVYVHPRGGQLKLVDFKSIIELLEECENPEIRLTMTEGVYFRNLDGDEAKRMLEITESISGKSNVEFSVSCIGTPICQMGILNSQKTLGNILDYLDKNGATEDVLPQIHISGCPNSCGFHESAEIGFMGKMKMVNGERTDVFTISILGSFGENRAKLGEILGDIKAELLPKFIFDLYNKLLERNESFKEFVFNHNEEFKSLLNDYLV